MSYTEYVTKKASRERHVSLATYSIASVYRIMKKEKRRSQRNKGSLCSESPQGHRHSLSTQEKLPIHKNPSPNL